MHVMYLKALKIKGFKSFGKPVSLRFGLGLSVIVGPNGAGKSNLVDAILWVLGEQNPRFLRGQSMQDVIFAGTDRLPPAPMAEVVLVFDNSDFKLPFEAAEISIKRVVTRDGVSTYFINERPCRLLDIRELISHMNLGTELPGIVPQNRVHELINPNSSDLRAIIEEASGISFYRLRRDNAVKKLKNADLKLEKINLIQNELQSQLKPLKKQAEALKQVIELKKQVDDLENRKNLAELVETKQKIQELEKEIAFIDSDINKADAELESLESKRRFLESSLVKENQPLKQLEKFRQLRDYKSRLEFIKMIIEEKARNLIDRITTYRQQLTSAEAGLKNSQEKLANLRLKECALVQQVTHIKTSLQSNEQKIKKLLEEKELLLSNLFQIDKNLKNALSSHEKLGGKIALLKRELELKKEDEAKTGIEVNELKRKIKSLQTSLKDLISLKENLDAERETLKSKIEKFEKEKAMLKGEVEKLEDDLNTIVVKIEQLILELDNIRSSLAKFNLDHLKIDDIVELKESEISLLKAALPYEHALYIVYTEDLETSGELPLQFMVTRKGKERIDFNRLLVEIEHYKNRLDDRLKNTAYFHPAGFYYRPINQRSYYSLVAASRKAETKLDKLQKEKLVLEAQLESKKSEFVQLSENLKLLYAELGALESSLEKADFDIRLATEKADFYTRDLAAREKKVMAIKDEISSLELELEKLIQQEKEVEKIIEDLEQKRYSLQANLKELETKESALVIVIEKSKKEITRVEQELQQLRNEAKLVEDNLTGYQELISVSRAGAEKLESRIGLLNRIHSLVEEYLDTTKMLLSAFSSFETIEETLRNYTRTLNDLNQKQKSLYERKTKLETRKEILKNQKEQQLQKIEEIVTFLESKNKVSIETLFEKYMVELDSREYENKLRELKKKLDSIGEYNPFALRDYELLKERLDFLKRQAEDIKGALNNLQAIIDEVDRKIITRFEQSFARLNENFNLLYSNFTGGGEASIRVDSGEQLEDARFIIEVKQPGKKLKNINLLSGGEKALASLALLMALEKTFKVPFMVLDEVEPALDEVNLQRVVGYLKDVAKETQIIMITHQPLTVEAADTVYGVTVDREGCSRIYNLKISEVEAW